MGVRLWLVLVCLLSLGFPASVLGQMVCPYNFAPSSNGISADAYEMSIFAIGARVGDAEYKHGGTAYLIRTHGDYALTAAHVVEDVNEIVGKSDVRPGDDFEFEFVGKTDTGDSDMDVALLRLVSGTLPQDALRLEFRGTEPHRVESLVGLGHPEFGGDYELATTEPIYRRRGQGGMLVFETRTTGGASGSPVFDEAGRVVATVVENSVDRQVAIAHPSGSQAVVDLLVESELRLSVAGEKMEEDLRDQTLTRKMIVPHLQYRPYNVSNIDLLLLSKRIEENAEVYNRAMLACPLVQAMVQRGVPTPRTHEFAGLLEEVETGALRDGLFLLANGEPNGAKAKFELSFDAGVLAARYVVADYVDWPMSVSCYAGSDTELPG